MDVCTIIYSVHFMCLVLPLALDTMYGVWFSQ